MGKLTFSHPEQRRWTDILLAGSGLEGDVMARYCVIGAGAAGISAFQEMQEAGHEVVCFEQTDRVGGHWHTDYEALHLITSRDMTHFDGHPMPASYPHFPRRDQVRAYIESYAEKHGLYELIQFGVRVERIIPVPGDGPVGTSGWQVRTDRGDEGIFTGVLVANGHLWDPFVPEVPGEFSGRQHHSSEYNNVDDLAGDHVLVVGAGNSGCDLAVDVAQHRREVDIVVKRGIFFQPKAYFGRPRSELPFLAEFAPEEQDLLSRLLARVSIGENRDYPGMPDPEAATLADGPTTVNDLLLYWVHHGRVQVRPAIERLDGDTVHFTDGSSGTYTDILWATGFNARLPFLADDLVRWEQQVPVRYAGGIVPDGVEGLYFIGLIAPRGPQIPIYGEQAKLVARMVRLAEKGVHVAGHFKKLQEPETRIDIVRAIWNDQMADTERLLQALEARAAEA